MNTPGLFFLFSSMLMAALPVQAQELAVPLQMRFAEVELSIDPAARNKIQNRANSIMSNWNYYRELSERFQIYAPIIKSVLKEENCPEDLQYMALQLSGLMADAISPRMASAKGFWLLPLEVAREQGLTVDNNLDERKSILPATRAFARAMQKNNYSLRNWFYAALAYQVGLSNALAMIDRSRIGLKQIEVTTNTPDMLIDLLAYTHVFRNPPSGVVKPPVQLLIYTETQGKTLEAIAKATDLPLEQLRYYNSWLLAKHVPQKRNLPVYLPVTPDQVEKISTVLKITPQGKNAVARGEIIPVTENPYPVITNRNQQQIGDKYFTFATINGIPGIIAADGQTIDDLAGAAKMSKNRLLKLNDLSDPNARLQAGEVFYVKPKRNKGPIKEHVVQPGESLQSIAQMYAMTLKSLQRLNRLPADEVLKPGRVLALQERVPKNTPPEYRYPPHTPPIADMPDDTPSTFDPNAQAKEKGVHIVQPGESIYDIAQKYGVTITELRHWNGLTGFNVTAGMELKIKGEPLPKDDTPPLAKDTAATSTPQSSEIAMQPPAKDIDVKPDSTQKQQLTHTVQPGDNIYSIALQYGIKLEDLRRWNNLQISSIIKPGDVLKLYDPNLATNTGETTVVATAPQQIIVVQESNTVTKHKVQRGENLTRIAQKYGVTVSNLRAWNNLKTDALAIGQELIVSNPTAQKTAPASTPSGTTFVNVMPQSGQSATNSNVGVHRVVFGESVEDIIRRYQIDINDFYRWNNLPVGTTALVAGTNVYVADPATVGKNEVTVVPQPIPPTTQPPTTSISAQPSSGSNQTHQSNLASNSETYTVQAGETLFSIARKYNIPISDLMRWNGMDMNTRLQVNQVIRIQPPKTAQASSTNGNDADNTNKGSSMLSNLSPLPKSGEEIQATAAKLSTEQEEARVYTTVPGDNIYDLANRFGIRLSDFRRWNNIPAGTFTLPPGMPIALNEAAAAQVAAMKAKAQLPTSSPQSQSIVTQSPRLGKSHTKTTSTAPSVSVIYHIVSKGETLYSIAKKYKVQVSQLKAWNKLSSDRINAGERIIVRQ
ncbi:MAG: LysM peptidoglycan-binding domain-containing protein [Cytophagales bacterium]|nr:LysM peptidoglycan-binding domain-containing protein [Bernardetiaceae bacterium]MDW8211533.1 LysM peptidoglycan-binding domain-containing protein [Cytophagales bacterium]